MKKGITHTKHSRLCNHKDLTMGKYCRCRLVSLISKMNASHQPTVNTHVDITQTATLRTFWFVSATRGMRPLY